MTRKYLVILIACLCVAKARAQNLVGNSLRLQPTITLPTSCNTGDLRYGAASSSLQLCINNGWGGFVSGTVSVTAGGTGLPAGVSGGILGFTSTTAAASSVLLPANQLIVGGGAGATPVPLAAGLQYQSLVMGATTPGYGSLALNQTAAVSGALPIANGGTGQTTATTGFNALSPLTTLGDVLYGGGSGAGTRLPGQTAAATFVLSEVGAAGAAQAPTWLSATNSNTAGTVVLRDGSGNFTAGTIFASLTGTASVAGTASFAATAGTASAANALVGIVSVPNGGTGQTAFTANALLFGNGTAGLTQLGEGSVGTVLIGQGSSTLPAYATQPQLGGTAAAANGAVVLGGSTSGLITLTVGSTVAGTYTLELPSTIGTLGQVLTTSGSNSTPASWSSVLANPMTLGGQMIIGGAAGAATALASGTAGQVLQSNGTNAETWVNAMNLHQVILTSGTSWTAPAGVTTNTLFKVVAIAGGGGGGGALGLSAVAGGGGGAGTCVTYVSNITAAAVYTYGIGAGGTAGTTAGGSGGIGGNTTISIAGTTYIAGGGTGGTGNTSTTGAEFVLGGNGGGSTSCSTTVQGGVGGMGVNLASDNGVGGGGGSSYHAGYTGNTAGANAGVAPTANTGQGGGGGNSGSATVGQGGAAGATGKIIIEWVQ